MLKTPRHLSTWRGRPFRRLKRFGKPVPLDLRLAKVLWDWRLQSPYPTDEDWVFASPHSSGPSRAVINTPLVYRQISPLYEADRIRVPLLVGNGGNDPRVDNKPTEMLVAMLRQRKSPVTFVVYPDEGHGFDRPENNIDFFGRVEDFLNHCLGGRNEPWKPVAGSSVEVR